MEQQPPAGKEWDRLADDLAVCLADLSEDEFLILSSKRENYFVQFAAQGQFGMRIEAASNVYVEPPEAVLAADEYSAMAELGWKSPTGVPGSEPRDPDGSPNFFLDLALPVNFRRVADMAVQTLRQVYRISHPGQLQYRSFDRLRNRDPLSDSSPEARSGAILRLLITFSVGRAANIHTEAILGSNGDHRPGGLRWGLHHYRRQALRRHRMAIPNGEERDGAL